MKQKSYEMNSLKISSRAGKDLKAREFDSELRRVNEKNK